MRIPWMNKGSSGIAVIDHKVGQVINLPYHHILELTTAIPKDPTFFLKAIAHLGDHSILASEKPNVYRKA